MTDIDALVGLMRKVAMHNNRRSGLWRSGSASELTALKTCFKTESSETDVWTKALQVPNQEFPEPFD